jgi:anti-sigma B factor antagonist
MTGNGMTGNGMTGNGMTGGGMTSGCAARVRALPGAAAVVLSGDVDGAAAEVLSAAYEDAVSSGAAAVVLLDFAEVGYINSTGIALIVSVLARARSQGRKVIACGLSPHYREIFDITRLSDFIELYPDLDGAISRLAAPRG